MEHFATSKTLQTLVQSGRCCWIGSLRAGTFRFTCPAKAAGNPLEEFHLGVGVPYCQRVLYPAGSHKCDRNSPSW